MLRCADWWILVGASYEYYLHVQGQKVQAVSVCAVSVEVRDTLDLICFRAFWRFWRGCVVPNGLSLHLHSTYQEMRLPNLPTLAVLSLIFRKLFMCRLKNYFPVFCLQLGNYLCWVIQTSQLLVLARFNQVSLEFWKLFTFAAGIYIIRLREIYRRGG